MVFAIASLISFRFVSIVSLFRFRAAVYFRCFGF